MRRNAAFPGTLTPEQLSAGAEFTDRDPQLPADPRYTDAAREGHLTGQMITTPPGEPPIDYDVRSVFDSRPINGIDFNFTDSAGISSATAWTVNVEVPEGYVAVLRGARHFLNPAPATLTSRSDVLATLLVNEIQQPSNRDIPVGVQSDDIMRFFVLIDELNTMGITFTSSATITSSTGYVTFFGNLISKTGRPVPFEVANPVPRPLMLKSRTK